MLTLNGHHVAAYGAGQEAITAFRAAIQAGGGFDVVVTDLGMPYMDGTEVARRVKEISPRTPVILISGWGGQLEGDGAASPNVDRELGKPTTVEDVIAAIHELLGPDHA